jgi:hypothetical protein
MGPWPHQITVIQVYVRMLQTSIPGIGCSICATKVSTSVFECLVQFFIPAGFWQLADHDRNPMLQP